MATAAAGPPAGCRRPRRSDCRNEPPEESGPEIGGATGDGRQDRHVVALGNRGVQATGEPDVLVIDVDVHEPVQRTVLDQPVTSASVAPSAKTVFSPFVTGRRMVGTDTETLIKSPRCAALCFSQRTLLPDRWIAFHCPTSAFDPRSAVFCNVMPCRNDFDRLFGDHTVHDSV